MAAAGAGLFAGVDVYKVHHYPNPPVMGIVLRPFMELPPITGAVAWLLFKAGLAVITASGPCDWKARRRPADARPRRGRGRAPRPIRFSATSPYGNVNLFIGFLAFAFLELFRKRLDIAAGLTLALAVACKVTPALFIPYLVWKRAWRALAGVAVWPGLWLAVVPGRGIRVGTQPRTVARVGLDEMVRPFVVEGKVTSEHANQSSNT